MDKTLAIIVGAAILTMLTLTVGSALTDTLIDTSETKNQLANNTKCDLQIREAKRADEPEMVPSECLDQIEDEEFGAEAEQTAAFNVIA